MWSIPSLGAGASATLTYTETTDAPSALESDDTVRVGDERPRAPRPRPSSRKSMSYRQPTSPSPSPMASRRLPRAPLTSIRSRSPTTVPRPSPTPPWPTPSAAGSPPWRQSARSMGRASSTSGPTSSSGRGSTWPAAPQPRSPSWARCRRRSPPGGAFVNLASGSLPPGQVDTDVSTNAVDSDSVIQVPQAIAFTPPTLGIAGQSATLSATGGPSGNPVVFSVDPSSGPGVCSVTGTDGTTLRLRPARHVRDRRQPGRQRELRGGTDRDGDDHRRSGTRLHP